jgi:hypothetical protein
VAAVTMPVRWRARSSSAAGSLAELAGRATGRVLSLLPAVPGVAGAAMVSLAAGEFAGHVFGHGLTPWVAVGVGGVFALLLDRRI